MKFKLCFLVGLAVIASGLLFSCSPANDAKAYERAKAEFDEGNYQEAIALFKELVASQPENPEAVFYLGVSLQMTESFKDAIPHFTAVLKLDDQADNAAFNRANCWYGLGQYSRALTDYELVLKLSPERYAVYNPVSHMRFLTGDTAGACEAWQIAKKYYADKDFDPAIVSACLVDSASVN